MSLNSRINMIGLLGGTFDPIHYGHLRLAWEAKQTIGLNQVLVMPCHIPPHRETPQSNASHRLQMARLACSNTPGFEVDDWELQRATPSYTVETLCHLKERFGDETALVFIMGMDAFNSFSQWHQWDTILSLCHLWVAHRPGSQEPPPESPEGQLMANHSVPTPQELAQYPCGKLHIYQSTALEISATKLRSDISAGIEPRFLLPELVRDYIEQHRLYQQSRS